MKTLSIPLSLSFVQTPRDDIRCLFHFVDENTLKIHQKSHIQFDDAILSIFGETHETKKNEFIWCVCRQWDSFHFVEENCLENSLNPDYSLPHPICFFLLEWFSWEYVGFVFFPNRRTHTHTPHHTKTQRLNTYPRFDEKHSLRIFVAKTVFAFKTKHVWPQKHFGIC